MPLPTLNAPEFNLTLPSNKKDIIYRPFTVKEQKALLIARESNELKEVINATEKIVASCCNIDLKDVKDMPYFDIEWLFLHIRGKSIGEDFKFVMSHPESNECKTKTDISFTLEDIKFELEEDQDVNVKITDDIGVTFSYPTFNDTQDFTKLDDPLQMYKFIIKKIKSVYDNERVYDDFTLEEAEQFIDSLKTDQYQIILDWFNNIPVLRHEIKWKCKDCGKESSTTLNGLQDFFL